MKWLTNIIKENLIIQTYNWILKTINYFRNLEIYNFLIIIIELRRLHKKSVPIFLLKNTLLNYFNYWLLIILIIKSLHCAMKYTSQFKMRNEIYITVQNAQWNMHHSSKCAMKYALPIDENTLQIFVYTLQKYEIHITVPYENTLQINEICITKDEICITNDEIYITIQNSFCQIYITVQNAQWNIHYKMKILCRYLFILRKLIKILCRCLFWYKRDIEIYRNIYEKYITKIWYFNILCNIFLFIKFKSACIIYSFKTFYKI